MKARYFLISNIYQKVTAETEQYTYSMLGLKETLGLKYLTHFLDMIKSTLIEKIY